jgi:diaminohydroxyphosphoribosylaminopyrimidine deaminase/5-amino-6-(5-phosphoribosylamino)uracil reductase
MVGAVLVRDGEVVGEGYHAEWGQAHAEVEALRVAGDKARGATLYVSLEPCHHTGKTGPCSQEILGAGVARVVVATPESSPEARGGGDWLREKGIEVDVDVCRPEADDLNAVHLNAFRRERPFVALKYALSLDGRLSSAPGTRTAVTQGVAIAEAHCLRAGYDAVAVGIGTALADDPLLTVREWGAPRVAPSRVVLDTELRLPLTSRLAETAGEIPVWVFTSYGSSEERAHELEARGVEVLRVPRDSESEGLDLGAVLATLWKRKVRSVLCEGGGRLGSAFLAAGLVDRFYAFVAPRLFGEPGVLGFQGSRGVAPRDWRLIERRELGPVTLLELAAES